MTGTVRDISIGGLGVHTDGAVLKPNALVYVSLQIPAGPQSSQYDFRANVIWSKTGRAGLMFLDNSPDALRELRRLLSRPAQRSSPE